MILFHLLPWSIKWGSEFGETIYEQCMYTYTVLYVYIHTYSIHTYVYTHSVIIHFLGKYFIC